MSFGSLQFLSFFGGVFCLYWLVPYNRMRVVLLVVASYAFYSAWDYRFCLLLMIATVLAWGSGRLMSAAPARRRPILIVSVAAQLAILGCFKYFNFFRDNAIALAAALQIELDQPTLTILLPVGISFYILHSLCYTIDSYAQRFEATRYSLLDVALYVAFFPQLIAGPIMRAAQFLPQVEQRLRWSTPLAAEGIRSFMIGLVYKYVIADNLGPISDIVFAAPGKWDSFALFTGVLAYYGQIYFDFAGYSLMAIGCSALLGYVLPPNFDHPYLATSITDFWRRWHMSLSSWLRDYVFIPLGGSRRGRARYYLNLLVTMGLGGLWHGAAWTFVAWGLLHGAGIAVHKVWLQAFPSRVRFAGVVLGLATTQMFVLTLWVLFRAPSLADAVTILTGMLTHREGMTFPGWLLGAVAAPVIVDSAVGWFNRRGTSCEVPAFAYGLAMGMALETVCITAVIAFRPFIYFQF